MLCLFFILNFVRNVDDKKNSRDYPWERYTLKELLRATNNFHQDNKIGEGGFGSVYWGQTNKGVEVIKFFDLSFKDFVDHNF